MSWQRQFAEGEAMESLNQEQALAASELASIDRRAITERRQNDRRKKQIPVAHERRSGKDRREGERRRQVDPTTCERDYTSEEIDFMRAMDLYKRVSRRQFPTWSEVLEVLRAIGYRKVAEPVPIPGVKPSATDSPAT
jgi:hypothetical protein